jgi:hypothetical protein
MSRAVSPIFDVAETNFNAAEIIFNVAELSAVAGNSKLLPVLTGPYGEKVPAGG